MDQPAQNWKNTEQSDEAKAERHQKHHARSEGITWEHHGGKFKSKLTQGLMDQLCFSLLH